jgi:hypothetical protein
MAALMPRAIQIDASSHCQLACPVCPTATGLALPVLRAGHLKVADFERLLTDNPEIREVELSNYGEMFLNPQLPDLLACAYERQVVVSGSNGVNLNFASEAALNAVVKYRVRALTCSIDGATQETYSRYRVNGHLDRVLEHVDQIRELRRSARSAFPLLDWQFVVMGHNEHEIERARAMAQARGMQFLPRLSWSAEHSPVVNRELVRIATGLGAATREEFRKNQGVSYTRSLCSQLWHAPVINWDGKMLGCCVNYWGDFGSNVFTVGLAAGLRHPKMEYARQMLQGRAEPRAGVPCTDCDQYKEMAGSQKWFSDEELSLRDSDGILVGLVLTGFHDAKFARISVHQGVVEAPHFEDSGRLFRFDFDTAVYFRAAIPGAYTAFVQSLSRGGWMPAARHVLDIAERPVCRQIEINASGSECAVPESPARKIETPPAIPFWVR